MELRVSSSSDVIDPYTLSRDELRDLVVELGQPTFRANQISAWLARGVDDPEQMTDLPQSLRSVLGEMFLPSRPELIDHRVADDGHTHKLLLSFPDGEA